MRLDLTDSTVLVTLSRRNLLALLAKVSDPFSAGMLATGNAYRDGEEMNEVTLIVRWEPEVSHYANRPPPGVMRPAIEAVIQRLAGEGGERN